MKKGKFQDLAAVMECDVLSFRPLNEVRWLSRHFAVIPFIRNYDVLIEYCRGEVENSNDPISKYCVKALTNSFNRLALTVLNDVLTALPKVSKFFQKVFFLLWKLINTLNPLLKGSKASIVEKQFFGAKKQRNFSIQVIILLNLLNLSQSCAII